MAQRGPLDELCEALGFVDREAAPCTLRSIRSDATTTLDGGSIGDPAHFYEAFFDAAAGLIPDCGGRNLDALADDLRELDEPLQVVWLDSAASRAAVGD